MLFFQNRTGRFSLPWIAGGVLFLLWLAPSVFGTAPIFGARPGAGPEAGSGSPAALFAPERQATARSDRRRTAALALPRTGRYPLPTTAGPFPHP
jgi:hypothetical protein